MKTYRFKINGNEYNIDINSVSGNIADVTVNGRTYQVEMEAAPAVPAGAAPAPAAPAGAVVPAQAAAPARTASQAQTPANASGKPVTRPLPGVIIAVKVNVGDVVKTGQELAVLEAMKMENSIEATHDGTVTAVHVAKGDSVLEGAAIVTVA